MIADPVHFARTWCEAWNAHDLDGVLVHFHDDVIFTSPTAARIMPESGGRIEGKEQLRAYWAEGLRLLPDLHFEVEALTVGMDTLVIGYRNQAGVRVNEVLVFEEDRIIFGAATHAVAVDRARESMSPLTE
jgi:ketosteroid isomerase-like protein